MCTLGPATSTPERMEEIIAAGMDVARLNMSHVDYVEHEKRLNLTRDAARAVGRTVGVLADLQGPKIRLGRFAEDKVMLTYGQTFTITTDDAYGATVRTGVEGVRERIGSAG